MNLYNDKYSMLESIEVDRSQVRILDIIKIDDTLCGRMDIVCMTYYNSLAYLPILLQFNHIVDPKEQQVGDLVQIPFLEDIISNSQEVNDTILQDWDKGTPIPYVVEVKDCTDKSKESLPKLDKTSNPLLDIKDSSVEYNPESGQLFFY